MGFFFNLGEKIIAGATAIAGDTIETIGSLLHPASDEAPGAQRRLSDLSKMTYKETYAYYKLAGHGDAALSNWQTAKRIDEIHTGLDARVYVNEATKEININFEGSHGFTKLLAENALDGALAKELYRASDGFTHFLSEDDYESIRTRWGAVLGTDGLADLQMMANKVPDQFSTAYTWFREVMDEIKSDPSLAGYAVTITGHSLGGSMAQMVSAKYTIDTGERIPTVAIDGTGVLSLVQQMEGGADIKDPSAFSHIVNFCTEGDPVGDFAKEGHLGFTVEMPYTLSRGDKADILPNYRALMEAFQGVTGIKDVRIDRHEIGQQIDLFDGTDFTSPDRGCFLTEDETNVALTGDAKTIVQASDAATRLVGNDASCYLLGGKGDDVIIGGAGNDFITGGEGADQLYGGAGDDLLYGGAGDDLLAGGKGDDKLYGGDGNDTLAWTSGNDLLYGQAGENTYLLGAADGDEKASGHVTLKFDRENISSDTVTFHLSGIDAENSWFDLSMDDLLLPSSTLYAEKDGALCIQYDEHSSLSISNWSDVKAALGDHLTISYGGGKYTVPLTAKA